MAEEFDVATRLAEGRPAVDTLQNYVWACHLLGYQNPDLTLHPSQLPDWYSTEEGLDLQALRSDCVALESAVAAADSALTIQQRQLDVLPDVWRGAGQEASREFLRRHDQASAHAAAALRTAAQTLAALRGNLWHLVDGKVAAAAAMGERANHADWRTAANTVLTGAGDRAAASELIDQQVKPFVDNVVRGEWLTAMRAATAAVVASFDAAVAGLSAQPETSFEVPGDLGPSWTPLATRSPIADPIGDDRPATGAPAAGRASTSFVPPAAGPPPMAAPSMAAPPMAPPLPPPAPPLEPPATVPSATPSAMPGLGGVGGGGLPTIGSGLSALGQQFADVLGSLIGSLGDTAPEPQDIKDIGDAGDIDDPTEPDHKGEDSPDDEEDNGEGDPPAEETADTQEPAPAAEPVVEDCAEQVATEDNEAAPPAPESAAPTPVPEPLPAEPQPAEPPPASEGNAETPCEIAADELPQAGR